MPAVPEKLIYYLKTNFDGATINSVYEAGFSGFHLHRKLVRVDVNNIVVHPGSIILTANRLVKTDRLDALRLSLFCAPSNDRKHPEIFC